MFKHCSFVFAVLFAIFSNPITAQSPTLSITSVKPDGLFVCGSDEMTIVVQNTGGLLSAGALLTVTLPDGLTYLPGSVSNVTEQNISNLAVPVFSLPAIPGGASVEARLIIRADCRADVAVNTGTQFFIQMAVTAPNVSVSASTLGFVVETGQIIITGVSDLLMEGERFDTLYRTICVTNTRLGKIGDIYFEDSHPMGISVSVQNATPLFNTPFQYKALISQSLFTSLGNNDQWLDENEEVCFTEQIIITDCGFPEHLLPSNLNVGWGCAGDTCDSHSVLAHILVHPSTKVQELSFKRISNPITDNCGVVGATMGLSIKNIGQADATNVSVKFAIPTKYEENSIDQNSFRIVESNGVSTSISPNLTTLNPDFDCNPGSSKEVSVNVPLVLLQDSVQLLFDLLSCADACNQLEALINVEYFYRKDCPSNGFVSDTLILYTDTGYKINAGITTNVADCFFSGNSYSAIYKVRSKKFTQPDGFLHLELSMPSGISLDSSCNTTLNGISPLSVEITGTPYQGYTIHWIYALPLPSEDVQMDFCLNYKCDSTTVCSPATSGGDGVYNVYAVDCRPCFGKLGQRSYWTPTATTNTDCGIGTCSEYNLVLDNCNENETTGDGNPPAGLTWKFETKRLNRGFKDSDDDRINDDDTIAPEEEVRLDRYLAGDTMQVFYCARLDSGSLPSLRRVIYHEAFRSDFGGAADNDQVDPYGLKEYFCNAFTFRFLDDSIRIHYASGETVGFSIYDLIKTDDKNLINILIPNNFPNDVLDVLASKNHEFFADFNDLFQQGLLPFPNLSPGDSIFFYTRFKIGMNFNPIPQGKTDPALIGFRTAMNHSNTLFAWRLFPSQRMQYSGFLFRRNMPIFNIKPCEPSIEVKKFKYAIRIARENLFPFEVRPLATLNDFKITTPPGLVVSNVNLEYLALQDSTVLTNDLPLPYAETPGLLDIDFTPAFEFKLDEGFMLGTSTIFEANCTLRHPDSSQLDLITQFEGCLNGDSMIQHDRIKSQIGYFTNHPNLELITNDSILTSAARDFEVNFNIKNPFVNSALHPWISIQSLSGLSTNFKLFKQPQNQTIAQQNDVFNIPAIPGFSQVPYKLTGTNLNCQTDSVLIIFGWDCEAVSSLAEASCYRDTYLIRINLLDSELELDVLQEHTPIDLCDTTEYFEFEIYNAKLGYTYDLFGTVRLPQNMQIVPGSSQIYYEPAGAWVNIPDPESLGSNLFRWNISENQPQIALTGLPGILSEPSNAVKIRFKAIPLCGYVANTAIVYGTYGKQACGRSTNVLNKPGEPININGINPTYGVVVSVQPLSPDTIVCGDIRTYQVELNLLGTPSVGDSVYILLPAGASLIANSYTPGVNAPAGPPTLNPEGFSLPLPSLTGGGTMNFLYGLQFSAAAGCEDQLMAVQTRVHTEAFCVALGAPCDIYVSTGEALLVLPIKNPELTLQNLSASVHGNEMEISTNISNISEVTAPGALVQIWFDADGNQQLSSMDVLITTMSSAGAIAAGAQENLSATTTFDPSFMCSLIAVMPADENCSCDDVILPLENWQFYHDTTAYCDLSPIQIGISETGGSTYHWLEPASGIACLTCSSTTFTPDANTPLGTLVSLNLLETNGTCKINHQFSFTFGAGATISINNAVICEGTSATLTAGPGGQSYQWQGPGIVNPADASQTLTPSQTSTYAVTITYANGCTATAVSQINVLPSDSIFYPVLNVCEGEHINLFGEDVIATTGTFYKAYIKSNGCDSVQVQPVLLSPKLNTESAVIICAGESIQVFDTLINESGQVCRTFFSSITGCDSVHCVNATVVPKLEVPEQDTIFKSFGESIELGQGIVGFDFYNWIPQPNPPCNNCPTITVTPDSAGYFEYWQTVGNTVGCPDTVIWRVFVFPPCDVQHVDIPNAFTPNGDGANDVFQAIPSEGGELIGLLIVYDRWGEKVFESRGVLYWDGTIDGKPAPSDVYVYLIEVDCGEIKGKRVGDVTLIR